MEPKRLGSENEDERTYSVRTGCAEEIRELSLDLGVGYLGVVGYLG